ncbi:MAG TPA: hypothetical protein VN896_07925 [Methylomirabilota bacterium]|nr:hypothetical protein [Methylomirabilota bacterium]
MSAPAVAAYTGIVLGNVASILGASLLSSAWTGEAPKRSALGAGLGLVAVGTTLSIIAGRSLR